MPHAECGFQRSLLEESEAYTPHGQIAENVHAIPRRLMCGFWRLPLGENRPPPASQCGWILPRGTPAGRTAPQSPRLDGRTVPNSDAMPAPLSGPVSPEGPAALSMGPSPASWPVCGPGTTTLLAQSSYVRRRQINLPVRHAVPSTSAETPASSPSKSASIPAVHSTAAGECFRLPVRRASVVTRHRMP